MPDEKKIVIRHANSSLAGKEQTFEQDVVTLGRREDNDIIFDVNQDTLVSGKHAEIHVTANDGDRSIRVNDCGSRNGTYVNGTQISTPTPLRTHDRLTLGQGGPAMRVTFADQVEAAGPATVVSSGPIGGGIGGGVSLDDAMAADIPSARLRGNTPGNTPGSAPAAPPKPTPPPINRPVHKPNAPGAVAGGMPGGMAGLEGKKTIGLNTLMGVVNETTRKERRRTLTALSVVGVFTLLLLAGVTGYFVLKTSGPTVEERWEQVIADTRGSVYQVQKYRNIDGKPVRLGSGTAWSLKPGVLATNAHVGEMLKDLTDDEFVIARHGDPSNDLRLVGYKLHPGYESFTRLYRAYRPYIPEDGSFMPLVGGADVALLTVDKDDISKQAPPLKIAPDTTLHEGQSVAYAGFPAEGVNVNYDAPTPVTKRGSLTGFSGLALDASKSGSEIFIRHDLPSIGGASGSPIVNINGEVVALNFGNDMQGMANDGSRLAVSGFGYAVPVRLLRELVDGTAEKDQAKRDQAWEAKFKAMFEKGIADPERFMKVLAISNFEDLATQGQVDMKDRSFSIVAEGTFDLGRKEIDKDIIAKGEGPMVLVVVSERGGHGMKFVVGSNPGNAPINALQVDDDESVNAYYGSYAYIPAEGVTQVTFPAHVSSLLPTKVHYIVVCAEKGK